MNKFANSPGAVRDLGVGMAGAVPGGIAGLLSALAATEYAKSKGSPMNNKAQSALGILGMVTGGALGSAGARKLDGQFDPTQWDAKGKKIKKEKPKEESKDEMNKEASYKTMALVPTLTKRSFQDSQMGKAMKEQVDRTSDDLVPAGAITAGAGAATFGAGKAMSRFAPDKLPALAKNLRQFGGVGVGVGLGAAGLGALKNNLYKPMEGVKVAPPVLPKTKDEGSLMDKVKDSLSNAYDSTKSTVSDAYKATKDTVSDTMDLPYAKPALAALVATPVLYALLKRRNSKKKKQESEEGLEKSSMQAFRAFGKTIPKIRNAVNAVGPAGAKPLHWQNISMVSPRSGDVGSLGSRMRMMRGDAKLAQNTPRGSNERLDLADTIRDTRSLRFQSPHDYRPSVNRFGK